MANLEQKVKGDWFDVQEGFHDAFSLKDVLQVPDEDIVDHIGRLRYSVEEGIVEYKKNVLNPLFRVLESNRYQSLGMDIIREQLRHTKSLLYITGLQRLYFAGIVGFHYIKKKKEPLPAEALGFTEILKDIDRRRKSNPAFAAHPVAKNIQAQISRYQKERATMQKLLPTIKPEAKGSFVKNFKSTFSEIFGSIRKGYLQILEEESDSAHAPESMWAVIPWNDAVPVVTAQCRCISLILSTLTYVKEEKYKTRETLAALEKEKTAIEGSYEKEMTVYREFVDNLGRDIREDGDLKDVKSGGAAVLSRKISQQIVRFLEKDLAYLSSSGVPSGSPSEV